MRGTGFGQCPFSFWKRVEEVGKIKTPSGTPRAEFCSSPANAGGNYFFPDFLVVLLFLAEEEAFFELDFLVAFFMGDSP